MTRLEHLLFKLAEECVEVAQRASKAARFGIHEIQPDQPDDNAERLIREMEDLIAAFGLLSQTCGFRDLNTDNIDVSLQRIQKYLEYSQQCGTLGE